MRLVLVRFAINLSVTGVTVGKAVFTLKSFNIELFSLANFVALPVLYLIPSRAEGAPRHSTGLATALTVLACVLVRVKLVGGARFCANPSYWKVVSHALAGVTDRGRTRTVEAPETLIGELVCALVGPSWDVNPRELVEVIPGQKSVVCDVVENGEIMPEMGLICVDFDHCG